MTFHEEVLRADIVGTFGEGHVHIETFGLLLEQRGELLSALEALVSRARAGGKYGMRQDASHEGLLNCDVLTKARTAISLLD